MPDSGGRTPQHQRRARTRSALLRAAGRVFAERGYHGATLDDVLVEAGVSRGALYHYFRSKHDLFLALLRERLTAGLSDAGAVLGGDDLNDGRNDIITTAAAGFLDRVQRDPRWLPLLLEFLAAGSRDAEVRSAVVASFFVPAREQTTALIRHAIPEHPPGAALSGEELAVGVNALINGLALEQAFDPDAIAPDLAGRLLAALRDGAIRAT